MKIETYLDLVINGHNIPYKVITSSIDADKVDIRIKGVLEKEEVHTVTQHIANKISRKSAISVSPSGLGFTDISFRL